MASSAGRRIGSVTNYNYSHDNDDGFLLICNDGSQHPSDTAGNTGTIVCYNISQNDHGRGINIAGPVKNTEIYNNTMFIREGLTVDLVLHSDWHGGARHTFFYNNIFYVNGKGQFGYGVSRNPDGAYVSAAGVGGSRNNTFDSNIFFGNITPPNDPHALTIQPGLVSPGKAGAGRNTLMDIGYAQAPQLLSRAKQLRATVAGTSSG